MEKECYAFQRAMDLQLLIRIGLHPVTLAVYGITWYRLYRLCRFGQVSLNLVILLLCAVYFLLCLAGYLLQRHFYRLKNDSRCIWILKVVGTANLTARDAADEKSYEISFADIKKVIPGKDRLYLFCSERTFYVLTTKELDSSQKHFLKEKLGSLSFGRRCFLRPAAWFCFMIVTVGGIAGVVYSMQKYNGELGWYLSQLQTTRRVTYTHDNIYEDGIDGLLADLEKEISLPTYLKLETGFNLHFAPDGTVTSLEMGISGFDDRYRLTESWLISYDADKSEKITIWIGGIGSPNWEPEKDIQPLLDALRLIGLEETVSSWPEETEFGILFYGERSWGYNTKGIRYIDRKGSVELPADAVEEIIGPTVSVFVPGKEEELTPVRYLFCEDVTKEKNIQ